MPRRRPPIESHPRKLEIDYLLGARVTGREIAKRFAVSECTISRYRARLDSENPSYLRGIAASKLDTPSAARLFAGLLGAVRAFEHVKSELSRIGIET